MFVVRYNLVDVRDLCTFCVSHAHDNRPREDMRGFIMNVMQVGTAIGVFVVSPAVMIYIAVMITKRIDDLKSKMESDHAHLVQVVENVDTKLSGMVNNLDKKITDINYRLENLNQNFIDHLTYHATTKEGGK